MVTKTMRPQRHYKTTERCEGRREESGDSGSGGEAMMRTQEVVRHQEGKKVRRACTPSVALEGRAGATVCTRRGSTIGDATVMAMLRWRFL